MRPETLHNKDEAALVKRCRENDPAAQKAVYMHYVDEMMILCLRYIVDPEDAREVLMDGFLNCFKSIGQFNHLGSGSLKAWLKKIMVNQCLMHLRKRRPMFVSGKEPEQLEDTSISDNVLDAMSAKEIMQLVHALPEGYRTVFNLYVFEGKNHREIGELLHISENTSKSQLHRARAILQKQVLQVA